VTSVFLASAVGSEEVMHIWDHECPYRSFLAAGSATSVFQGGPNDVSQSWVTESQYAKEEIQ
jgi:hypothetical protein